MKHNLPLVLLTLMLFLVGHSVYAETRYVDDTLILRVSSSPSSESDLVTTIRSGDKVTIGDQQGSYIQVTTDTGAKGWVSARYLVAEKPAVIKLKELESFEKEAKAMLDENIRLKAENARLTQDLDNKNLTLSDLQQQWDEQSQKLNAANERLQVFEREDQLLKVLIKENETFKKQIDDIQQILGYPPALATNAPTGAFGVPAGAFPRYEFSVPVTFEDWKALFQYIWSVLRAFPIWWYVLCVCLIVAGILIGRFWVERRIRNQYSGVKIWS
ncbi:MAG TPA: TIGR04211 family SH3 domain-containing protein [Gammaproteobacteria bacterium]|nr:TIGR04211 family SH3 domain-containing protein [Gammaproteobacteria bacterium]